MTGKPAALLGADSVILYPTGVRMLRVALDVAVRVGQARDGASVLPADVLILREVLRLADTPPAPAVSPATPDAVSPPGGDVSSTPHVVVLSDRLGGVSGSPPGPVDRISVKEAAAMLGTSVQYVRRLCAGGQLAAVRGPRGAWRIDRAAATVLAEQRQEESA